MKVCFVSGQTLKESKENGKMEKADLYLFGFGGMGEVRYERELQGQTTFFEEGALFSKEKQAIVVSGCITDTRGHKRKSALVAERGRIKGVSDMLHVVDGRGSPGACLRVYETKLGKMGIAVAEDLRFPEVFKALVDCGSDFIVCPYNFPDGLTSVLLRANAYFYGTPILFCGSGYAMIANSLGELVFSTPQSPVVAEFENKTEYHLIERRKKGFFR